MDDEHRAALRTVLTEEHGIPARKISGRARIVQDLGIDGDDASDLLESLQARFGTDFSVLDTQWNRFFVREGFSPFGALVAVSIIAIVSFGAGIAAAVTGVPDYVAGVVTIVLSAVLLWLGYQCVDGTLQPITVGGLVEILKAGRWPSDPANIR